MQGCVSFGAEETYPGWKPGEMDLHFVYTGCGENMFYRLPDGTSILNDTGDYYRPRDLAQVPLLPSPERLGGEWMSRYISRVYPEKMIDYLIFSHWHSDHIGHMVYDRAETPAEAFRFRTLPDGRRINGFLCVAEDFSFSRYFDHQGSERGRYGTHDTSMKLVEEYLAGEKAKGLVQEEFRPGALDQIRLLRNPEKYKGVFSVRNICANGRLWDGKDGVHDYAAGHVAATGAKKLPQNPLSLGFVIQYGRFRYWAGGDVNGKYRTPGGGTVNYEAEVGKRIGKVTVCKMNHHGCSDSMCEDFVRAVRADAYVSCVWCPSQVNDKTMVHMASGDIHGGVSPRILPNLVPASQAQRYRGRDFMENVVPDGPAHIVVKVHPGGESYSIYLLDPHDESMRVMKRIDCEV